MYPQFHTVKEPSKNHDICVRVLFGSLRGWFGFLHIFTSRFGFGSWHNLGSSSFVLAGFGFFPIPSCVVVDVVVVAVTSDVTRGVSTPVMHDDVDPTYTSTANLQHSTQALPGSQQRTSDDSHRHGTSVSETAVLPPAQSVATSGTVSGSQLADSPRRSTSLPLSQVNLTNNALLAILNKLSRQSLGGSALSQLAETSSFVSTSFPARPDVISVQQLAASMTSPFFFSPVSPLPKINDDFDEPADVATESRPKLGNEAEHLSDVKRLFEALKLSEVKADVSRDRRQRGTSDAAPKKAEHLSEVNRISETSQPAEGKTDVSDDRRQRGTAHASNVAAKTTVVRDRPRPRAPPAAPRDQTRPVPAPRTMQASQAPAPTVSQITNADDVTGETGQIVKFIIPRDAFTLRATVKRLLESAQQQQQSRRGASDDNRRRSVVKTAVVGARSERTADDDAHNNTAADATEQPSSASAEHQKTNGATEESFAQSAVQQSSESNGKEGTRTKLPAAGDDVPQQAGHRRSIRHVVVEARGESEIEDNVTGLRARAVRFEIEDSPSPIHADDRQIPSPSPSDVELEELLRPDQCSVCSDADRLPPSPMPELELDSESMRSLKRLFPTLSSLVRVTLVPPRRRSNRNTEHDDVEDEWSDRILSEETSEESPERETAEDSLSEDDDDDEIMLMEEAEEKLENLEQAPVQFVHRREATAVVKPAHPSAATRDESSSYDADRFQSLPTTQAAARPTQAPVQTVRIKDTTSVVKPAHRSAATRDESSSHVADRFPSLPTTQAAARPTQAPVQSVRSRDTTSVVKPAHRSAATRDESSSYVADRFQSLPTTQAATRPTQAPVQSLRISDTTSAFKPAHPGAAIRDESTSYDADRFPTLPKTQSAARPTPDDVVSVSVSSSSASTELPLLDTDTMSDLQLSLAKTLTQRATRVLPPNKTQSFSQTAAQKITGRTVEVAAAAVAAASDLPNNKQMAGVSGQ